MARKRWYKKLLKWIFRQTMPLLVELCSFLLYIVFQTLRCRWYGIQKLRELHQRGEGVIYAFWHQRMLAFVYTHRGRKVCVLVSPHRDGELITQVIHRYGFVTVRGSSRRQSVKGLLGMLESAKVWRELAITPDGPKGPPYRVQPGVIKIAQWTGRYIVPGAYGASQAWEIPSWDRFLIPLPFSRIAVCVGTPLQVPSCATPQKQRELCLQLERELRKVTEQADRLAMEWPKGGRRGFRYVEED